MWLWTYSVVGTTSGSLLASLTDKWSRAYELISPVLTEIYMLFTGLIDPQQALYQC